jgi:hypothetical protein
MNSYETYYRAQAAGKLAVNEGVKSRPLASLKVKNHSPKQVVKMEVESSTETPAKTTAVMKSVKATRPVKTGHSRSRKRTVKTSETKPWQFVRKLYG